MERKSILELSTQKWRKILACTIMLPMQKKGHINLNCPQNHKRAGKFKRPKE